MVILVSFHQSHPQVEELVDQEIHLFSLEMQVVQVEAVAKKIILVIMAELVIHLLLVHLKVMMVVVV
tara:strand:- start:339 stop:539 length:201 start_codon:yes stop_codon:yes gene_type:complete